MDKTKEFENKIAEIVLLKIETEIAELPNFTTTISLSKLQGILNKIKKDYE